MENPRKNRKALIVGIVAAAMVVLAALLVLLLTQCGGGPEAAATGTVASTSDQVPTYELYWNADRALYDGKSEAGMSSRTPEADGYFHIRFILDGREVTLKAADRKTVNKIDVQDLMGLVFDEEGMIIDVVDVDDMPLERLAWKYFVQSTGGNMIKLNSSKEFVGMEVLLECGEQTRIYDMTGKEGPIGSEVKPVVYDRVIAIANLAGELTHVFIYDRSDFMLTHEGECEHCDQTVTWYEWTKTDSLPGDIGHYQLQNDITVTKQLSLAADVKLCLDLNGYRVDGAKNTRMISLHNAGAELALMDTSEEKTGVLAGHSTASPQGGVVWVRYGAFYMYGGTLDGSDMVSRLNGTVVQVPKNAFFYMHGGTIIGGTAAPQYVEDTGKYNYGLGGSVQVSGIMRMYGGTIRDGKAPAAYYYQNGKLTCARGMGGNIFLTSGAVLEIHDGQILNGYAGNVGGNIMMDGTAELIIHGGTVSGGWIDAQVAGKNGANIYCPTKGTIEMNGGTISGGNNLTGGGGNIYLAGTMNMSGGVISGGRAKASGGNIQVSGTGKLNLYAGYISGGAATNGGNIALYSKASLNMYSGTVTGGKASVSGGNIIAGSSGTLRIYGGTVSGGLAKGETAGNGGGNLAITANSAKVHISGGTISGGTSTGIVNEDGTTAGGDGGNINLNKGTLTLSGGTVTGGKASGNGGGIYVGWNSVGLTLSQKAMVYGNAETDICRSANTAEGKSQIILGAWDGNGEKGALVLDRLSATAGTVLAVPGQDITLTEADVAKFSGTHPVLPIVLSQEGNLILSTVADLGAGDHLHCLCGGSVRHTCADTGFVSVTAEVFYQCWIANGTNYDLVSSLNLCLTEDVVLSNEYRLKGNTLNLCLNGHTVTMQGNARLTANGTTGVLNLTDCGDGKIVAEEGCRSSILYTYKGSINIYGGTVDASRCAAGNGGAVNVGFEGDSFTLYGGTLVGGKSGTNGGSIYVNCASTVNIHGGTVTGGKATGLGGNIYLGKDAVLNITGGEITGGQADGKPNDTAKAGMTGGIYVGYTSNRFTLSGDAKIYGNTGSDVYLGSKASNVIILNGWAGNADKGALVIGKLNGTPGTVLATGAEGAALTDEDAQKLASADEELLLGLSNGSIVLKTSFVHDHCVCGNALAEHACTDVSYTEVKNTGDFLRWFDDSNTLSASADLVLTGDIVLDAEYKVGGNTLNLCLNGHTVTMQGNARLTANGTGGVLNVTDCGTTGNITAAENCRTSILYTYKGEMNIYGGTVNASECAAGNGGAVTVGFEGDSFTLYGGTLVGSKSGTNGGSIYCAVAAAINIHGGTVTGGQAANQGGNIYISAGTLNISGGEITGGSAITSGNIHVNGNDAVVNISGGKITNGKATGTASATGLGGNIHVIRGTLNISGGTITGGSASGLPAAGAPAGTTGGIYVAYNCKALNLSGDAKIYGNSGSDIYLTSKPAFVLTLGDWAGNGENGALVIGKLNGADGTLLAAPDSGITFDDSTLAKFASAHEGLGLAIDADGKMVLEEIVYHTHCVCAGVLADTEGHTCESVTFVEIESTEAFQALFDSDEKNLLASGNVCLTGDVTLDAEYKMAGNTLNLCLNGHTVTMTGNGRITANGTTGVLNITDCGTTGNITAAEGCRTSILYTYKGEMNIYGGTVDASKCAAGNGGAVTVGYAGDSFTLYGGTLAGSKSGTNGGSIYCAVAAAINIHGGTVTGGNASNQGGNIYMSAGTLNISGGTITGGSAVTSGNIHMAGDSVVVNISGGTVSGGKATGTASGSGLGGNIHVIRGTLNITGGTVTGGSASGLPAAGAPVGTTGGIYTAYNCKALNLSGDAKIYGNSGSDIYLTSKPAFVLTLGDWAGNGENGALVIGKLNGVDGTLIAAPAEGLTLTQDDLAKFSSADGKMELILGETGSIVLKQLHIHCLCNGVWKDTEGHSCQDMLLTEVSGTEAFQALFDSDKNLLASGNVCLTGDVALDAEYKLAGNTLNLCLNGHTVTMTGNGRITANGTGGVLNITDCGTTGNITAAENCRTSILYTYKGSVNIYGGTVDASKCAAGTGGVVNVGYAGDSFTLYGGTLVGSKSGTNGAAIYTNAVTTVNIYGGTVTGGSASASGGNIYMGKGTLNITGGTVTGGSAVTSGGGIYIGYNSAAFSLSGNALIYGNGGSDIYLGSRASNIITLNGWAGNGDKGAAVVGKLNGADGIVIAAPAEGLTLTQDDLAKFSSADGTLQLALSGGNMVLKTAE